MAKTKSREIEPVLKQNGLGEERRGDLPSWLLPSPTSEKLGQAEAGMEMPDAYLY